MKKRIFSRVLALFMALSMLTTTVFAASLDDLQEAIDGTSDVTVTDDTTLVDDAKPADQMPEASEDDTGDAGMDPVADPTNPTESEDTTHVNGALVRQDKDENGNVIQDYFGYGWSQDTQSNWYYAIEAHDAKTGERVVLLLDDVSKGNGTVSGITISKDVDINMNAHKITGSEDATVIKVEANGNLDLSNGTITGGQIGIDVLGTLILDSVTVANNGTGVKINDGGKVTFKGDNKFTDNGADVELNLTLGNKEVTYKVDAATAEKIQLAEIETIEGANYQLATTRDNEKIVLYTGSGVLTQTVVKGILGSNNVAGATGFLLPEGVTKIDGSAFQNCTELTKVNIPSSVTSIGIQAFLGCKNLDGKIIIPASVQTLGDYVFYKCASLDEVYIAGNIPRIGTEAFVDCTELKKINIPDSVTKIGASAFKGCKNLAIELKLPTGLRELGNSAFNGCANLTGKVEIPAGVTSIGGYTFQNCEKLTGISFPENSQLKSIGAQAFLGCKKLDGTITIPASVETLGDYVFYNCASLDEVYIADSIPRIGTEAFVNCTELKKINIPDSVTKIGASAFKGCKDLAIELKLPAGLTELGHSAFNGCTNLTGKVEIPSGITNIDNSVFTDCQKLEEVTITGDVKTIGFQAFLRCYALTKINLPDSITTIGWEAFGDCTGLTGELVLPKELVTIGDSAFGRCSGMTKIVFPEESKVTSIGNWAFMNWKSLEGTVTIPAGVKNIGKQAFAYCDKLASVEWPVSLTEIGLNVIGDSGVKSIWIPSEEGSEDTAKLVADKTDVNIFIKADDANLSFYRGEVTADFGHYSADNDVNRDDGSVNLTNVSGTIATDRADFTLPNVARITASIDTNGNITIEIPAGGEEYPYGAIVTTDPDDPEGRIVVNPHEPPQIELPVISFDFDTAGGGTAIEDEEVPLAGLVTLAELLEALREYEGIEDAELPEDFQWVDHEYAQAIYWGLDEALVEDAEDNSLDPDEIVTVALLREVLENFVDYKGVGLTVAVEGEDDMIVMDLGERLVVFYGELEAALEGKAA